MKSYKQWMVVSMLLALAATGAVVSAQDKQADKASKAKAKADRDVVMKVGGGEYVLAPQGPDAAGSRVWFSDEGTTTFIASEMLNADRAVKGAPYSAQAVTEMVQTLADGNRIVRRTTASVYRDGEGRTRHDQSIGDVGPYATAVGEPSQVIMINDPVSGAHYTLEPRSKTARKMTFIFNKVGDYETVDVKGKQVLTPEQMAEGAVRAHIEVHAANGEHLPLPRSGGMPAEPRTFNYQIREPKVEPLGKQTIEGVEAEGRRATITIPAGEIGNEQPILIVDESWYSPELKVTVMSRHSDPRMGETVYRLTNVNRAEPARSLFEVPSDYTVKESVEPKVKMMVEREMQRSRKPADKQEN